MSPDDPRHGTWAGYQRGCRDECCTWAAVRYQKGRTYDNARGLPRTVPSLGTIRRIHALNAIGWGNQAIGAQMGMSRAWVQQVTQRGNTKIHRRTAERIADLYERLSMTLPPEDTFAQRLEATRARLRAEKNGWPPPLAWDHIDDPNEAPQMVRRQVDLDPVVVDRILDGDWQHPATPAERREVVRRWVAMGGSKRSLARQTGWKIERYVEKGRAA